MNFTKISNNTECDCFTKSNENTTDMFVRKVRRSENLNNADFRNHIERGKIPEDKNNCGEVCGYHGVSIELWNEYSSAQLKERYLQTLSFSPKSKNNLCVIKFQPGCGLVKHTPDQKNGYNEFHYDFYKNDDFSVERLSLVEMVPLIVE
ncbi:hypothetical protein MTO98_01045 [Mucilaginibacter sp. SMC90]|uniref:hypothetical protein n=1 Tax=Mucilaginibacter sp. SMC90 TaxID=2929803 RepID=UPI001FB4A41B|nr:hypothetical protein [Mucilaginibacter sp. SMC90]UOE49655.1 hypothetical protein MTO98_01045 [Mucilaginibacter sp. SMC90]